MANKAAHRLNPMAASDAALASNLAIVATAGGVLESSRFDVLMGALARLGNRFDVTDPRYGAVGDGTTNDNAAIVAAEAAAYAAGGTLFFPAGKTFNIGTTGITIRTNVDGAGATLSYSGTGTALTYGNTTSGQQLQRMVAYLPKVIQSNKASTGWAQAGGSDVGVRLINLYSSEVHIPHVQGFAVGLDVRGEGTGCVYNNVFIGHLDNNKVNHQASADSSGWSNENNYHGGRFSFNSAEGTAVSGTRQVLVQSASNLPNNNRWWGASLEGNVPEYHVDCFGQNNLWHGCRWEATTPKVKFDGSSAQYNAVIHGYNAQSIVFTLANGALRNQLVTPNKQRYYGSAGSAGLIVLSSSSSAADPLIAGLATAADPMSTTLSTDYNWQVTSQKLQGKRTADTAPRVEIDFQNQKVLLGSGGGTPTGGIQGSGSTGLILLGTNLGFFGTAASAKPTISGSRGGNAALASLLTALATLGLITDSTTA